MKAVLKFFNPLDAVAWLGKGDRLVWKYYGLTPYPIEKNCVPLGIALQCDDALVEEMEESSERLYNSVMEVCKDSEYGCECSVCEDFVFCKYKSEGVVR